MPPSTLCGPALCTGGSRSERSGFKRHCIQLASRGELTSLNRRLAPIGSCPQLKAWTGELRPADLALSSHTHHYDVVCCVPIIQNVFELVLGQKVKQATL